MNHVVITISRQYASGGHTIGEMTAKKLGIPFYDTEIIKEVVKKTGLPEDVVENTEQRATNSFLFNLVMSVDEGKNPLKQIYNAEKSIILEKAQEGPCVILGRSADFILSKENFSLLRVFIYSDFKNRIDTVVERYGLSSVEARYRIQNSDRERSHYSNNFHNIIWGEPTNYDIMLNTSRLDLGECSKLLVDAYQNSIGQNS